MVLQTPRNDDGAKAHATGSAGDHTRADSLDAVPPSLVSFESAALSRQETDVHENDSDNAEQEDGEVRENATEDAGQHAYAPPAGLRAASRTLMAEQEMQIQALDAQLAQLRKEEKTMQQKTWKANKMERKIIDAKSSCVCVCVCVCVCMCVRVCLSLHLSLSLSLSLARARSLSLALSLSLSFSLSLFLSFSL